MVCSSKFSIDMQLQWSLPLESLRVLLRVRSISKLASLQVTPSMVSKAVLSRAEASIIKKHFTGVNTGFGGSSNTHTDHVKSLQQSLISFLNCGIIASPIGQNQGRSSVHMGEALNAVNNQSSTFAQALPNEDPVVTSIMPESWVRAALLVRSNSLSSGYSGVRPELVGSLVKLLNEKITPVIPLRGSISASGDLIPLSYIAATLQGNPDVEVWIGCNGGNSGRHRIQADQALLGSSLTPLKLDPKEGLAIVNGTAVSTGVASLALQDAHHIAILSQVMSAMCVEALRGSLESFDALFSKIRPHVGQSEVSGNIRNFLRGSSLLSDISEDYAESDSLRQDRYSLRTATQWLGPQLEDLMQADRQLSIELNSTTDNPVIDSQHESILHGGNFQAMAVTSAMEKTRFVLLSIGRLIFAQSSEMMNPVYNNGLPPNLTADEPNQSFLLKGIDISMAALQSELGLLSTPVIPHVQNAEMGNQSVNSLALLSARFTHTAIGLLSQMSAAYLLALCQALDLRAMNAQYLSAFEPEMKVITMEVFESVLTNIGHLHSILWLHYKKSYAKTAALNSSERFVEIISSLRPNILAHATSDSQDDAILVSAIRQWTQRCSALALKSYRTTWASYTIRPDASQYVGSASKRMYTFIRSELGIPFQSKSTTSDCKATLDGRGTASVGVLVSKIHAAIQNGEMFVPVMECLRAAETVP